MKDLRAVVIGPAFFGYENDIVSELGRQGYETTFVDERPSNTALMRAIARFRKRLIRRRIESHFRGWQGRLATVSLDIVLVIKAEVVPRWFLEDLRRRNPRARFVFYTYDSIENSSNCLEVLDCFDVLLSFDRDDVAAYPGFSYLPLFYTEDFSPLPVGQSKKYQLSFVGTLHTDRYRFAKRVFKGRPDTFSFFFVQARWYFALVKYVTREHASVPWSDVSFTPLSRSQIAETFRNSRAVLDMQREGQRGLTMRTFEVLASGSVLVTTNSAIESEPFYDPVRIIVVPSDVDALNHAEVQVQIDSLSEPVGVLAGLESYALSAWVRQIIELPGAEIV